MPHHMKTRKRKREEDQAEAQAQAAAPPPAPAPIQPPAPAPAPARAHVPAEPQAAPQQAEAVQDEGDDRDENNDDDDDDDSGAGAPLPLHEEPPTLEVFQTMPAVESVTVGDVAFKRADNVYAVQPGMPRRNKNWHGHILDIRQDPTDEGTFWVRLSWLWTVKDWEDPGFVSLVRRHKSLNVNSGFEGPDELVQTPDFIDIITATSLAGKATIYEFPSDILAQDEQIPEHGEDGSKIHFYRFSYITEKQKWKKGYGPSDWEKCTCQVGYQPERKEESAMQHYCPTCKRWFHRKCRKGITSKIGSPLVNVNPEDRETGMLSNVHKRLKRNNGTPAAHPVDPELRELAARSIYRGGLDEMVGNGRLIYRARELVNRAWVGQGEPEDVESAGWREALLGAPNAELPNDLDEFSTILDDKGRSLQLRCNKNHFI